MQPIIKEITYGPLLFQADTGIWFPTRSAGYLQMTKGSGVEHAGKCYLELPLPAEHEGEAETFQGWGINFAEIQYELATDVLAAEPTLTIYRETMSASGITSLTVPLNTRAAFGNTAAIHNERVVPISAGDSPLFQKGDKGVLVFDWSTVGKPNCVLTLNGAKVRYTEYRT